MHNLLDTFRYISNREIWYIHMIGYYAALKQMSRSVNEY